MWFDSMVAFQILCIVNIIVAHSETLTWTEDHDSCKMDRTSSLKSCFEMPYIQYVRQELLSLGTTSASVKSWKYEMLHAINNLYIDLKIARLPSLICITKCNKGFTNDNSKYIYPISFGIPERFIVDSVPYKVNIY